MPRGVSGSEPETTFISAARQLEPGLGSNCKVQILISWSMAALIAAILWSDQTINYGVGQRCELAVESSGGRRMILRTVGGARGDRALSLRGCRPGTASIRPEKASFSMGGLPSRKKRVPDAILRYRWKIWDFSYRSEELNPSAQNKPDPCDARRVPDRACCPSRASNILPRRHEVTGTGQKQIYIGDSNEVVSQVQNYKRK